LLDTATLDRETFLDKRRFGKFEDSDEDEKYKNDPDLLGKSPATRRTMIEEKERSKI